MIRYAITDGRYSIGEARRLADGGVDFLQLRDKALDATAAAGVARAILAEIAGSSTRLLINGRADVAVAVGAAGVHLTAHADELTTEQVRRVFELSGAAEPVVSISCHSMEEALCARDGGADLILFAPVFEKRLGGEVVTAGVGLKTLRRVCAAAAPAKVLALGGVTMENAGLCVSAGAAGVAGIRMFTQTPKA